jgi:hypothetical protein
VRVNIGESWVYGYRIGVRVRVGTRVRAIIGVGVRI